ncbi:hypothetical protein MAR_001710, partial [Mya arenaria]
METIGLHSDQVPWARAVRVIKSRIVDVGQLEDAINQNELLPPEVVHGHGAIWLIYVASREHTAGTFPRLLPDVEMSNCTRYREQSKGNSGNYKHCQSTGTTRAPQYMGWAHLSEWY